VKPDRDDHRLRDGFRALRAHAERPGAVPDFENMLAQAKASAAGLPPLELVGAASGGHQRADDGRRRLTRLGGWVSLAAAAAAVGVLFVSPGVSTGDAEFERLVSAFATDAGAGGWRSPTSALLDVPGLDLGAVPTIGGTLRDMGAAASSTGTGPEGRDS